MCGSVFCLAAGVCGHYSGRQNAGGAGLLPILATIAAGMLAPRPEAEGSLGPPAWVRNGAGRGPGCGSQTTGHTDNDANVEELGMGPEGGR